MKKGLLTLLAASLVLVGCQNYDDQFDDLNAQISALKSQVDGLSSLSAQVSSLSGSISGLQAGVSAAQAAAQAAEAAGNAATTAATAATTAATAAGTAATAAGTEAAAATAAANAITATDLSGLEATLATLAAEVDAVQASLATAATSTAVAALQAELDAIEADVAELLAVSNVYVPPTGTLTINSSSTLDAATALGNSVNIVNGDVAITVSTSMNAAAVQAVINKIFTVTGSLTYTASSTEVTAMTFDKLASAGDVTLKQAGAYSLDALITAGDITLDDAYASKVSSVNLGALTTVVGINTKVSGTTTDDTIAFSSATSVDLGSLAYYTPATLTVTTKKDATLDISSLDDQTSTGAADDYTLIVNGPKDISISNWTSYEGKVTATNVENLTLTDFKGEISVGAGVENIVVSGAEQFALASATKLQTVDVEVVAASDPDLPSTTRAKSAYGGSITEYVGETPLLSFTGMADLTSVKLSGLFRDLTFNELGNLTSIQIDAEFEDLIITDNDDLTSIDVTGAKFGDLTLTGNDALVTADFDHTLSLNMTGGTTDDTDVAVDVSTNTELTSFTWGGSTISNLNVKTNVKLATIDFSAVTAMGADTTPTVDVYGNDLDASLAADTDDGTTDYAINGEDDADDLGSFTTSSGMETLKAFLLLVQAKANADAAVHFDEVALHTIAEGATAGSENSGEQNAGNAKSYTTEKANDITLVYANTKATTEVSTSTASDATIEKRAFVLDVSTITAGSATMTLKIDGTDVLYSGSAYGVYTAPSQNLDLLIAELKSSQAVSRAASLGATLDVYKGANSTMPNIVFRTNVTSASSANNGENYTNAQVAALYGGAGTVSSFLTTYDKFTLSVGGRSVVVTLTGAASYSGQAAANAVASQVASAWDAKYSTGKASADLSFWTGADGDTTSGTIKSIVLKDTNSGSRAYGQDISFTWTPAETVQSGSVSIATAGVATNTFLDWKIGDTDSTADNTAQAVDLIISLTETTEDAINGSAATIAFASAGITPTNLTELSTAKRVGTTDTQTTTTATDIHPADAGIYTSIYGGGTGDVVFDEAAVEGVTTVTVDGVDRFTRSRIHWLGS